MEGAPERVGSCGFEEGARRGWEVIWRVGTGALWGRGQEGREGNVAQLGRECLEDGARRGEVMWRS